MTTRSGRASQLRESAPLALPGRRGVWSGAGGPRRLEGLQPIPPAEVSRVCSISLVVCAYPLYRYRSWEHRPSLSPSPLGSQRVRRRQSPRTFERSSASWLATVPQHRDRSIERARSSPATDRFAPQPARCTYLNTPVTGSAPCTAAAPGTAFPYTHSAVSNHARPSETTPGQAPTPACVGHRPSTLDSQEER